ncbi:MAG TPA: hypothetical protein VGB17_11475 [Pyrinomonadaceae bacterium]|jgi:hypothetical protein
MLIDQFLPRYDVHERHRTKVHASLEEVYAVVRELDLSRARLTQALMRLRGMGAGRSSPAELNLDHLLKKMCFILLGERPQEELLLGLAGRFWKPSGELRRLDAEEFRNFNEPGYAKAAWNFSLSEQADGSVLLETETRVSCLDETSRRRFRLYWMIVGPFSGLLRRDMLRALRLKAEQRHTWG